MRLELNEKEKAVLLRGIEIMNDMTNDMLFEDVSANLYPKEGATTVLTEESAKVLRKELGDQFEELATIRVLLTKLGGKVNDSGYSV